MAGEYVNKEFLDAMAELEQTKGIKWMFCWRLWRTR